MGTLPAILAVWVGLAAPSILVGFLIGFGGVGGVLLAPALNVFGGVPIHDAIRICMWVYVLSGVVGTLVFLRNDYISIPRLKALSLGACPGALAGSFTLALMSAQQLEMLVAVVILFSGLHTLRSINHTEDLNATVSGPALVAIGLMTGFGSSLTGTGGPLILIPTLLFLRLHVKQTLGLAQAIQIPIGVVATIVNLGTGELDLVLGSVLAGIVGLGVLAGASMAHRSSDSRLKRFLGVALVFIAVIYAIHGVDRLLIEWPQLGN